MNLILKDPITISILTFFIIFILSFIILYFIKPNYIINIHSNKINYYSLFIYSLLFGNLSSIIIFMFTITKAEHYPVKQYYNTNNNYNPMSYSIT